MCVFGGLHLVTGAPGDGWGPSRVLGRRSAEVCATLQGFAGLVLDDVQLDRRQQRYAESLELDYAQDQVVLATNWERGKFANLEYRRGHRADPGERPSAPRRPRPDSGYWSSI